MEILLYYYILFCVLSYIMAMIAQNVSFHKFKNKKSRAVWLSLLGPASLLITTIIFIYILYKNNEYRTTKQKHF